MLEYYAYMENGNMLEKLFAVLPEIKFIFFGTILWRLNKTNFGLANCSFREVSTILPEKKRVKKYVHTVRVNGLGKWNPNLNKTELTFDAYPAY